MRALEQEIANIERTCQHLMTDPVSDPEQTTEWVFDHYEGHGSDPIPVGRTIPTTKPRWRRSCKFCGKTEYTYRQKPVQYAPDF